MNTWQLENVLRGDRITRAVFGGVFPSDELPSRVPEGKRLFIANTDPAAEPGQHWVALYFGKGPHCTYFDSYGLPPFVGGIDRFIDGNAECWTYNEKSLQDPNSTMCGHYCVFFAVHLCDGMSLGRIQRMFHKDKQWNDRMVEAFVRERYKSNYVKDCSPYNQTCCSRKNACFEI